MVLEQAPTIYCVNVPAYWQVEHSQTQWDATSAHQLWRKHQMPCLCRIGQNVSPIGRRGKPTSQCQSLWVPQALSSLQVDVTSIARRLVPLIFRSTKNPTCFVALAFARCWWKAFFDLLSDNVGRWGNKFGHMGNVAMQNSRVRSQTIGGACRPGGDCGAFATKAPQPRLGGIVSLHSLGLQEIKCTLFRKSSALLHVLGQMLTANWFSNGSLPHLS